MGVEISYSLASKQGTESKNGCSISRNRFCLLVRTNPPPKGIALPSFMLAVSSDLVFLEIRFLTCQIII